MATARVLVVDDEPDSAESLRRDLAGAGYEVVIANDGPGALAHLRHDGADLVVLDAVMPGFDGWQVLEEIEADDEIDNVPVVVVAPCSAEKDVIRARLSGAARCISRPIEVEPLLTTVREVLAPPADELRERRRVEVASLLQRLAELETGRQRSPHHVRLTRLERLLPTGPTTSVDPARLARLTVREREVAALFAAGVAARHVAAHLGSSRANVYATRKRIGRKLGVANDLVADTARALGLADEAPGDGVAARA